MRWRRTPFQGVLRSLKLPKRHSSSRSCPNRPQQNTLSFLTANEGDVDKQQAGSSNFEGAGRPIEIALLASNPAGRIVDRAMGRA